MRGLIAATAAAGSMFMTQGATALAWNTWCDDEPPLTVVTPGGNHVTVNNFVSAERSNLQLIHQVSVSGYAETAGPGHSVVHVFVRTPSGGSNSVFVNSTDNRFGISTQGVTSWGQVLQLDLVLPVE